MFFATTEVPLLFKCNPRELRHDLFTVLCSINPHLFLEQIDLVSLFTSNAFADKSALSDLGNILEITMLVAGDSSLIWVPIGLQYLRLLCLQVQILSRLFLHAK